MTVLIAAVKSYKTVWQAFVLNKEEIFYSKIF
jgi:hypothetical protein